jgi:hypothetical protein
LRSEAKRWAARGRAAITKEEALRIAETDALNAYRTLSGLRPEVRLEADGWHVDYTLIWPGIQGGGQLYIIDANGGLIIH